MREGSRGVCERTSAMAPGDAVAGVPFGLIGRGAAGALIGFAIVLWIAGNWQAIGRIEKFALVAVAVVAAAVLGTLFARLRAGMALLGVLGLGGLMALFGQVYQVSADASSLFIVWSLTALSWVIAARSDAAWVLWVAITFCALSLWCVDAGPALVGADVAVLVSWGLAIGVVGLLSPSAQLSAWTGPTWWSFRLACLLTLVLVASFAIAAVFGTTLAGGTAVLGSGILAAALAVFALARPFSLTLLAFAALAADSVLIAWVTWFMTQGGLSAAVFLVLGLIYAGIVAGSAVGVLRVARSREATGFVGRVADFGIGSHWAVTILSGIGALLTAVPVMAFLAMAFGEDIFDGAGTYLFGAGAIGIAFLALHGTSALSFRQQLGFIGFVVGACLVTFALFRDLPLGLACLVLFATSAGLAAVAPARWIVGVLGAAGGAAATWFFIAQLTAAGQTTFARLPGHLIEAPHMIAWGYLISAVVAAAGLTWLAAVRPADDGRGGLVERTSAFLTGWCALMLAQQMIGNPTFLIAGATPGRGGSFGDLMSAELPLDFTLAPHRIAAVALVAVSLAVLARRDTAWRHPAALALVGGVALLAYLYTAIVIPVVVFVAGVVSGRRALWLLAVATLVWLVGSFYYWLGLPLTTKAYLLAALGVTLGGVTMASGFAAGRDTPARTPAGDLRATPVMLAAVLTFVSVGAAFGVVGSEVARKEEVLANGRRVFVQLAPVDPRSLIRGDYMDLSFAAPPLPRQSSNDWSEPPIWAVADVDGDGVATIRSFAGRNAEKVTGDLLLRVSWSGRRMVLGTNAFFFEEGRGERYQNARYGVFRVGADGEAILTGLADEERRPIE